MTTIEKNFIQNREQRLQYLTLSRGVSTEELPDELRQYAPYGKEVFGVNALLRFDDDCKNGHCTFSVTGSTKDCGGCLHELLAFVFPELAPVVKWHLCSTDGPLHYIANTVYHVKLGSLEYARNSAIWPDATEAEIGSTEGLAAKLSARLPVLMGEFREAMESLGFDYEFPAYPRAKESASK